MKQEIWREINRKKANGMDLGLKEKVAIVTGGARGLGRAICLSLAAEGAHVAVNYRRETAKAEELVQEIAEKYGVKAVAIQADMGEAKGISTLFEATHKALGPVDILVNNAAIWPGSFVREMSLEEWDKTIQVNLTGSFLTCREAVREWMDAKRGGRIVNIVSQAAFNGATTGHAHYAASKAGLVAFTVSLARESAPHGIYVNAVAPGMMITDMAQKALDENGDYYMSRIPLGRFSDPAEVADTVTFLSSGRASYTTGATIDVTGGMLMR